MHPALAPFWTKTPALRLLLPLVGGILVQWYTPLPPGWLVAAGAVLAVAALGYGALPLRRKYQYGVGSGAALSLLGAVIGALLVHTHDVRRQKEWIGHRGLAERPVVVALQEPLVEKPNSFKAVARVEGVCGSDSVLPASGALLLYFQKDSTLASLGYGSRLLVSRPLQEVRNTGNPGAFDYRRYSLFQGITHQVYLTPKDYVVLPPTGRVAWKEALFASRRTLIGIIQTYLPGEREQGLAEALLIGYKDDLDKGLLQSYSNTGVVHVIAISGLHLGLIYWLLLGLSRPLNRGAVRWLRLLLILAGLWGFSLLAGAGPSVLRSCVMFSFVAFGEVLGRRTSIVNTLALSALLLLCLNPFWLWDIGFQLSYAAVLSLVLFYGPICRWVYLPNKALGFLWKLNAVTLAAQVLTLPVSLYHFHQFPVLFLLTNVVAVPLSSLILIGLIALCAASPLPSLAVALGAALHRAIHYLNNYIERMEGVSFVLWEGISISVVQTVLLTAFIAALAYWLMEVNRKALYGAALCLLVFTALRSYSFWQVQRQRKLIVYNVPKYAAMDLIEGRRYHYLGSPELQHNEVQRRFFIQPSRVLHRVEQEPLPHPLGKAFLWQGQRILLLDSTVKVDASSSQKPIDLLVLSQNPKVYLPALAQAFQLRQIVVDGSVPKWKVRLWKRDCDSLGIPFHDVGENGAFVLNL